MFNRRDTAKESQCPVSYNPMRFFLLATIACVVVSTASAATLVKISDAEPQDGVFVTNTGYMMTVLELKNGRFRYWFKSDAGFRDQPKYPLLGEYSVDGSRVTLKHERISQKHWTVRKVDGYLTLWRPDAIKMQNSAKGYLKDYTFGIKNFRRCGTGAILVLSDRPAEVAWAKPRYVEITEEQQRKLNGKKRD